MEAIAPICSRLLSVPLLFLTLIEISGPAASYLSILFCLQFILLIRSEVTMYKFQIVALYLIS